MSNEYAKRLASTVEWLNYYLNLSTDCDHMERAEELEAIRRNLDDIVSEINADIDEALYQTCPHAAADRRAYLWDGAA